ncbi:MAG TPA: LEPR-XLL domain-containing protein, partial [Burkholderiales bacterium]|nr:LEPR-XLL domain-containing protein [Burkholderiales bacterium]
MSSVSAHLSRRLFKQSLLGKLLRETFARWGRGKRPSLPAPAARGRRPSFALEAIEPRLLLSADISYALSTATHDFTLKATQGNVLNLYDTGTSTVAGTATLSASDISGGQVNVTVARGPGIGGANADTVHLDLNTFHYLNSLLSNSDTLNIGFDGGSQRLNQDLVTLDGTSAGSAIGYNLSVTSNSQISSSATATVQGNLSINSEQSGVTGLGVTGVGYWADTSTGITLTGANLTTTNNGSINLDAHSNLNVNTGALPLGNTITNTVDSSANDGGYASGLLSNNLGSTTLSSGLGLVVSYNQANIDISGGTNLTAAGDINLTSRVDGSLTASANNTTVANPVPIAVVAGSADPQVLIHGSGTKLSASGAINATATTSTSTGDPFAINTTADAGSTNASSSTDGAVAVTVFNSAATVSVTDSASVSATDAATFQAGTNLSATTTGDASAGNAGAGVAVSVVYGDTTASVGSATGNTSVGGSAVMVGSGSSRTIDTVAKSSAGGSADGGGTSPSQSVLSNNNAKTSQGSVNVAGAVAVNVDTGTTSAYLDNATINTSGAATVSAGSTDQVTLTADGSQTGDTSANSASEQGVGVAVAVNVADRSDLAYLTGTDNITASSLTVEVPTPTTPSSFDLQATSGTGDSSNVGFAGSLAINVVVTQHEAYIDNGATVTLGGANTDVTIQAYSDLTNTVHAGSAIDPSSKANVGIGAAVAFNYAQDTTAAYIDNSGGFAAANAGPPATYNPGALTLTADSVHEMTTAATGGGAGSESVTPVVA